MARQTINKRTIEMGDGARSAVELMERVFGGRLTHDSGHKTAPMWIFDFDDYGGAQAAVRLNKDKLSLYLRANGTDGKPIRPFVERVGAVEDEYPTTKPKPANSLLYHAPYLSPTGSNRLLLVSLMKSGLRSVLDAYFGQRSAESTPTIEPKTAASLMLETDRRDGSPEVSTVDRSDAAEPIVESLFASVAAAEIDADPNCRNIPETERRALINARIGQGRYRKRMLGVWDGKCAVTGCGIESVLVASHAKAWASSSNKERLDEYNGLLLAASVDRLFDTGLIAFADDGTILVRQGVDERELRVVGLTATSKLRRIDSQHRPYLGAHRQRHGFQPG